MAVNPRSAPTDFPPPALAAGPTVPTRAPTTQLSSAIQSHVYPAGATGGSSQLLLSDPSAAVMLRPLQQAHSGGKAALGKEHVSYIPEITAESQLGTGQIEASQEQKLIDPALTAETKSIEEVYHSFDKI